MNDLNIARNICALVGAIVLALGALGKFGLTEKHLAFVVTQDACKGPDR